MDQVDDWLTAEHLSSCWESEHAEWDVEMFPWVPPGETVLCVDCQSNVMAVLCRSGRLVVRDVENGGLELLCTSINNPYRVFVHPLGSYVVVSALDGEVYCFASYDSKRCASVVLQPSSGNKLWRRATQKKANSVLVGHCVTWLDVAEQVSADSTSKKNGTQSFVVGTKVGHCVVCVDCSSSPNLSCAVSAVVPIPLGPLASEEPITSISAVRVGDVRVLMVSTPSELVRAVEDVRTAPSTLELLRHMLAGSSAVAVSSLVAPALGDDAQPMQEPIGGLGQIHIICPDVLSQSMGFAWLGRGGVVHGLWRRASRDAHDSVVGLNTGGRGSCVVMAEQKLDFPSTSRSRRSGQDSHACFLTSVACTPFATVMVTDDQRLLVVPQPLGVPWNPLHRDEEQPSSSEVSARAIMEHRFASQHPPKIIRDDAEGRMLVYDERKMWSLTGLHTERQQWEMFLVRATERNNTRELRERMYDAASTLAAATKQVRGPRRSCTDYLYGKYLMSLGSTGHGVEVLARCEFFAEVHSMLSTMFPEHMDAYLTHRLSVLAEIQKTTRTDASEEMLFRLILMILMRRLHLDDGGRTTRNKTSMEAASSFVHDITDEYSTLLTRRPQYVQIIIRVLEAADARDTALRFAADMNEHRYCVMHFISTEEFVQAAESLSRSREPQLWYDVCELVIRHAPIAVIAAIRRWLDDPHATESLLLPRLLPAFVAYSKKKHEVAGIQEHQVLSILDHAIVHHRCTEPPLHNYFLLLLADTKDQKRLITFLQSSSHYQLDAALRLCLERGYHDACMVLYLKMGFMEDALTLMLSATGVPATTAISRAVELLREKRETEKLEEGLLKRLWLSLAHFAIAHGQSSLLAALEVDAEGLLRLQDYLPADAEVPVKELKSAICRQLDACATEIAVLKQKSDDVFRGLEQSKHEMEALQDQCGYITGQQRCILCRERLLVGGRPFLIYPSCQHAVHEECAIRRIEEMGGLEAFFTDEGLPAHLHKLSTVEELALADCVVCGEACVVELDIPLYEDDGTWAISARPQAA